MEHCMPLAVVRALLLISGIEPNPGPIFECKECTNSFSSITDYSKHVLIHQSTKSKRFLSIPCCWCDQWFKNVQSFQSHITRFHQDKRQVKTLPHSHVFVLCPVCDVQLSLRKEYLKHMADHLKDGKSFKCPLSNCKYVNEQLEKFRSHTSRYHPEDSFSTSTWSAQDPPVASTSAMCENMYDEHFGVEDSDSDGGESVSTPLQNLFSDNDNDLYPEHLVKDKLAKFYLKLESSFMLPTEQVQAISQEVKLISELSHHSLKKAMKRELEEAGANKDVIESVVAKTFKSDPVYNVHHKHEDLDHLGTHHLRDKFWKNHFPYITPVQVQVGTDDTGKSRYAHYIPIRETLSILLRDKDVTKMVEKSFTRQSESGIISDYCDGLAYKEHMKQHHAGKCLQLLLFQDAFDVSAFTAAQGKFKPVGFYYILGNLPPVYRSKVDLIQLVYMILEKDLNPSQQEEMSDKDKMKSALKILLDEIEDLKTNGIMFNGEIISVCVLFLIGDSLGQHQIGGYVRSFNCEFFCRFCSISKTDFKQNPHLTKPLRSPEEYDKAVSIAKRKWTFRRNSILRKLSKNVKTLAHKRTERILARCSAPEMKKVLRKNISNHAYRTMCAVNYRGVKYRPSPFNSAQLNFHVSSPAMPPCLAHDIFEGCAKIVLPRILKHFIEEQKWFDLTILNRRIKSFKCKGLDSRDAPVPLKNLEKLHGNAVENWNLLRLLPFMVGDFIKDEENPYWELYLQLREIVDLICAPKITVDQVAHLQALIQTYQCDLKELLPSCLIPKDHFLSHYPELILQFGPLIRLWTLRFESKHMFFKKAIRACKSFVNITHTLAKKYMCQFAYDHCSGIIPPSLEYDPSYLSTAYRSSLTDSQIAAFPEDFRFDASDAVDFATVNSIKYSTRDILVMGSDDGVHLNVGCIHKIIIASDKALFLLEKRAGVNSFKGYYEIQKNLTSEMTYALKGLDELPDYYPLPLYEFGGKDCLCLKHSITCMVSPSHS